MSTRIGISFGLALTLVLGIVVTMLALGVLTPSKVAGQEATAVTEASVVATPNEPGAAARYVVAFTTSDILEINDVIVLEFENEYQVPTILQASAISISGTGAVTMSQFAANPSDVTVRPVGSPANQHQITLTVPDMNPADEVSEGLAAMEVRVTFAQTAGIENPLESAPRTVKITTSDDEKQVTETEYFPRVVKISGSDGGRGKVLTVTGLGYISGTTATVWLDRNQNGMMDGGELKLGDATVASDKTFVATITVNNPPFTPGKGSRGRNDANAINASDGRGNSLRPTDTGYDYSDATGCIAQGGRTSCLPVFELRGSISVSPSTASVGDTIQVTIKDFDFNKTLTQDNIDIGGIDVNHFTATTNNLGEATFNVTVPNGVSVGQQSLNIAGVCCTGNGGGNSTRRFTMNIGSAVLTLTPTGDLVPNQTVTMIGRGFTTGGGATINGADISSVSISGNPAGLKASTSSITSSKINENKVINIDNGGNWSSSVVIPINSTTTTPGAHVLKVTDNDGREGTLNFTIAERTLNLQPQEGRVGTMVQVTGTGYASDNTGTGVDSTPPVTIVYVVSGAARTVTTLNPDSSGNISGSFIVPLEAGIPSTNSVRAVYEYGPQGSRTPVTTASTHSVPRAVITVEPDRGPIGTMVTISGVGFKTFSSLSELKLGDVDVRPAPVPSTDNVGNFTTTLQIPQLNTGTQNVIAKVGGAQGTTASGTFLVQASAMVPTPGVSAATETVFAPVIAGDNLVRVWRYSNADKSWSFYDPRPAFADANTLTMAAGGNIVWVNVAADQIFQGQALTAGWNLIVLS